MSAFIVSEKHLQTLINWANINDVYIYFDGKRYKLTDPLVPDTLLTVLHRQNVRSVDDRYQEANTITDIKFRLMHVATSPVQILKACDCYDYQACETGDYKQTFANAIIEYIRSAAISKLPGYETAKWEIS